MRIIYMDSDGTKSLKDTDNVPGWWINMLYFVRFVLVTVLHPLLLYTHISNLWFTLILVS